MKSKYRHAHHFDCTDVWRVLLFFLFNVCGQLHHFFGVSDGGSNEMRKTTNKWTFNVIYISFIAFFFSPRQRLLSPSKKIQSKTINPYTLMYRDVCVSLCLCEFTNQKRSSKQRKYIFGIQNWMSRLLLYLLRLLTYLVIHDGLMLCMLWYYITLTYSFRQGHELVSFFLSLVNMWKKSSIY